MPIVSVAVSDSTFSVLRRLRSPVLLLAVSLVALRLPAQVTPDADASESASAAKEPSPAPSAKVDPQQHRLKAAMELRQEEHQRILGLMPNFNTSNVFGAEPLSPSQKFELAAKSAFDPFAFIAAGVDAGFAQLGNDFPGYRQGALGYGKRFGASYADTFDGTIMGNALFPILLKQDPRYFRKGTGTFKSRFLYAIESTVKCKDDNGKWAPNYSNVLGNIAAGGIANLYYPRSDRGVDLTFQRAFTVTAEGAIGAVFVEFWPDISRKLFPKHRGEDLP